MVSTKSRESFAHDRNIFINYFYPKIKWISSKIKTTCPTYRRVRIERTKADNLWRSFAIALDAAKNYRDVRPSVHSGIITLRKHWPMYGAPNSKPSFRGVRWNRHLAAGMTNDAAVRQNNVDMVAGT